jgi:hypothetical protein
MPVSLRNDNDNDYILRNTNYSANYLSSSANKMELLT